MKGSAGWPAKDCPYPVVWPGGLTSEKLQALALVERQLVYAEVDKATGAAGSWF